MKDNLISENIPTLILASASPRRIELLKNAGIDAVVHPADADETLPEGIGPEEAVKLLSFRKAEAVLEEITETDREKPAAEETLAVIGADTVVSIDGEILGKPRDEADAARMLRRLSGRSHTVYTGVTLLLASEGRLKAQKTYAEASRVHVCALSDNEIDYYIRSGEPMDKAGAYGIQGLFSRHVSHIEGDYFNIVGLPVSSVYEELKRLSIDKISVLG